MLSQRELIAGALTLLMAAQAQATKLNAPYDASAAADYGDNRVRRVEASLGGAPTLRVQGRQLVNGAGQAVQLRGVNRAVFESR